MKILAYHSPQIAPFQAVIPPEWDYANLNLRYGHKFGLIKQFTKIEISVQLINFYFIFQFQLAAESDAEVSQFDSLENCSDGGMSAENFNTLKKVPLAPIDPPPEFQVYRLKSDRFQFVSKQNFVSSLIFRILRRQHCYVRQRCKVFQQNWLKILCPQR